MNAPRGLTTALLVLACLVFVIHARSYRDWVEDDAYITYRYARNLAAGEGMVYNAGEKVEGYSNTAWVLLAAATIRGGNDPLPVTQGVAVVCGLIALLVSWRLSRLLWPDIGLAAVIAPWFLALTPVLTRHATSGLETNAFAAAVGLSLLIALEPAGGWFRRLVLVIALLATILLRPEGSALALLILLMARGGGRLDRISVLVVLVVFLGFHAWRLVWFGSLLPNTFHAKLTGGFAALRPGLHHALDFVRETGGAALVGFTLALFLVPGSKRVRAAIVAVVLLQTAVVVAAGGDWMYHYRLLAPVMPLLAATLAAGAGATAAGVGRATGHPLVAGGVVAAVLAIAVMNTGMIEREVAREVMPSVQQGGYLTQSYRNLGRWLQDNTPDDALVAVSDIGAVGWYSDRRILDMLGLIDPHVSRRPGILHAKFDAEYVLEQDPDVVVLVEKRRADGTVIHRRLSDQALADHAAFAATYEAVHTEPIMYMGETARVYLRRDDQQP